MNDYHEGIFSMLKVVRTALEPHTIEVDAIPILATGRVQLNQIITDTGLAIQKQSINVTGQTEMKKVRRQKMSDATYDLGQAVSAYALANGMLSLNEEVDIRQSSLNRLRDEEIAEVCTTVYDRAFANKTSLAAYGITEAKITELKNLIKDYSDNSQVNIVAWEQKNAQTERIRSLLAEATGILKNVFDKVMPVFKASNPELYNSYVAARNSMPRRKAKKSTGEVIDEEAGVLNGLITDKTENIPIENAEVKLTGTNYTTESDELGNYIFDSLPAGNYSIAVSKSGYQSATLENQTVTEGEETVVDFKLLKA